MSDKDLERFRQALRLLALDAAIEQDDPPPHAFEPLSQEAEDRLVSLAYSTRPGATPAQKTEVEPLLACQRPKAERFERRGRAGAVWSRPVRAGVGIALGVAAAATVVWFAGRQPALRGPTYVAVAPSAAPLPGPGGRLLLSGSSTGGAPVGTLRLKRKESLSLILRPQKNGSEAAAAYSFIRHPGEPPRAWDVVPQSVDKGVFVLSLPLTEAPDIQAEQDLLFVFGPAGPAPDPLQLEQFPRDSAYSTVKVHLVVTE